ncbi:uncharacterized protein LOC121421461 [Lytechinus variegatus]|uniref:uncharacterized protein LOC121421461 n=1 Tax=Lytechinus variegatus TaxID=7654 RepID=UPI001BB0FBFB|nr:uncharacterized protein LOC121421461 [Lytechinus variegatus]
MVTYVFILVLTLASCAAKIMHVQEGGEVELHFSYPCNSTRITLQYGYKAPCFSSNPWSKSMPPNQELEIEDETDDCCIKLTISPVSKDDAGTYILTAYRNGIRLPEYPRIGLRVAYPPRQASCEINDDNSDNNAEWLSLHCRAPQGTLPGQIICYQDGMRLPNRNGPRESGGHVRQELLARLDGFVRCCSSTIDHIKEERNCTDWGWDPMSDRIFEDISHLTPEARSTDQTNHLTSDTVTVNITTTTPDIAESFPNRETEPVEYAESQRSNLQWVVSFTLSMSFSVIIIIILSIKYHHNVKEMQHLKSSLPPKNASQPGNTCLQSPNKCPDESNV